MEINSERLDRWLEERMKEGEDATAETFVEEVLDKSEALDAQDPPYDDLKALADSSGAKIGELESSLADSENEIARLKAHNYDLLMASGSEVEGDGVVEEVVTDDGEVVHIDNLFVDSDDEREVNDAD